MKRLLLSLFAVLCVLNWITSDLGGVENPSIPYTDRIRLAEAFRLADAINGKLWKDWNQAPFAILLITPQYEFLIRHPAPSSDFQALGTDVGLDSKIFYRNRTQPLHFLATFPLSGPVPTIVIGQAENTAAKSSTKWIITLLHEHFHQFQMSQPSYFQEVEKLNLSGGDRTGMWMLNYAFPYDSPKVEAQIKTLSRRLHQAVLKRRPENYFHERKALKSLLNQKDYAYLSFQIWQEGISLYTEYKVAEWAAKEFTPSPEFLSLADYEDFGTVASDILENRVLQKLKEADPARDLREIFYAFGAAEGLLLDELNPGWRNQYWSEKFFLENYLD